MRQPCRGDMGQNEDNSSVYVCVRPPVHPLSESFRFCENFSFLKDSKVVRTSLGPVCVCVHMSKKLIFFVKIEMFLSFQFFCISTDMCSQPVNYLVAIL
jgi:hypothetical protein